MSNSTPPQSHGMDDEIKVAVLPSLSSKADSPSGRRLRRWSLPDSSKLPSLVAAAHKLDSATEDNVLPLLSESFLRRRRRSMSDFDDLKPLVAHLPNSSFRDAFRFDPPTHGPQPMAPLRGGVRVTRWRVLNTLFIAIFGFYKSFLTFEGHMTGPTVLDWLLGVFWAIVCVSNFALSVRVG
jgi:hypothetical protein